jgi:ABC-type enterochelin transport system permease subunit
MKPFEFFKRWLVGITILFLGSAIITLVATFWNTIGFIIAMVGGLFFIALIPWMVGSIFIDDKDF